MNAMRFGVYFFTWYERVKWEESPRRRSPLIGEYDSDDPAVLGWQLDQIQRCGFDFVVFELLPLGDWCAKRVLDSIALAIPLLRQRNLSWSFLLDADVLADKPAALAPLVELIGYIEANGWHSGLVGGPTGKPLLLVFKPLPQVAAELLRRHGCDYDLFFAVQFKHWEAPEPDMLVAADLPFLSAPYAEGRTLESELLPLQYVGFWQPPGTVKNYHGICPVIPSYDDLLLQREPQVTPTIRRQEGVTYFDQFSAAVASGASHIIVYGWNEYFEEVTLEPATGYGEYYCDLTRAFIRQAKQGLPLRYFPRTDFSERRQGIDGAREVYVWDERPWEARRERFAAKITVHPSPGVDLTADCWDVAFTVQNCGLRAWLCDTGSMPIRLGARLLDRQGTVLREQRAAAFRGDVQPGEIRQGAIRLDFAGLGRQVVKVELNLVYEQRFWFDAAAVMLRPPWQGRQTEA